jgi:methylenetetrahydrofolate reductase (NADPH)
MEDVQETTTTTPKADGYSVIAEIDPPKGANLDSFISSARQIRGMVDFVRVTDSEHAIMRMAPLAPCLSLREHKIAPIMVINGRDRNKISFQGDLLGAASLGITDILLKEGHDPAVGDQPVVGTSGDLDLTTMLKCLAALNDGSDLAGEPLEGKTEFRYGVSLDLTDDATENRRLADSFDTMADLGVSSVSLGPTYDLNILDTFLPAAERTGIKLYTSIIYLKSVAMIRYLNNLPGTPAIPQEFLKKMMSHPVKKDGGMQIAADLFKDLKGVGDGTVLLAIGWGDRLAEFLKMIDQ